DWRTTYLGQIEAWSFVRNWPSVKCSERRRPWFCGVTSTKPFGLAYTGLDISRFSEGQLPIRYGPIHPLTFAEKGTRLIRWTGSRGVEGPRGKEKKAWSFPEKPVSGENESPEGLPARAPRRRRENSPDSAVIRMRFPTRGCLFYGHPRRSQGNFPLRQSLNEAETGSQ